MPIYIQNGSTVVSLEGVDGLADAIKDAVSVPVVTEPNASRVSSLTDIGKYLRFTSPTAQTYTVVNNTTVDWPVASEIHGRNSGTGEMTIVVGSGVTVNLPYLGTYRIPTGGTFTLKNVSSNEWDLFGQTVPV